MCRSASRSKLHVIMFNFTGEKTGTVELNDLSRASEIGSNGVLKVTYGQTSKPAFYVYKAMPVSARTFLVPVSMKCAYIGCRM